MGNDSSIIMRMQFKKVEEYYDNCQFAEMLIEAQYLLSAWPNSPYLLRRLAFGYFREGKISQAKKYIEKSWSLFSDDGLVIWDYAQYLWVISDESRAINVMKRLSNYQPEILLTKTCSSLNKYNISMAKKLINDSRFIIGEWYYYLDKLKLSFQWFNEYTSNRRLGVRSDFKLKEATDVIETISNIKMIENLWASDDDHVRSKLKKILHKEASKNSDDDWFLGRLASLYLESRDYTRAINAINMALEIEPEDSIYLWRYAQILERTKKYSKALAVLKKILNKSDKKVSQTYTSNSLWYAKALKNDCRYHVGLCYEQLGRTDLAVKWIKSHLDNRQKGLRSNYSKKDVLSRLRKLTSSTED